MSLLKPYFTVGMAGHIDHGKTTLTKALTGVNTDRLKEEQERNISIELGFAPLINQEDLHISLVDVPGHENFIRQMIAGVAGIDFVLLVIAADEGVMPQTNEHLTILSLLGLTHGFVVLTKMDLVEPELLEIVLEDVKETLHGTFLEEAPFFQVDSKSLQGIPELKHALEIKLTTMTKTKTAMPFRLPIDHRFTVKGQGVVVRGTIYNGMVKQGDILKLLPNSKEGRVRQIQTHGKRVDIAQEGQRTAINLGGIALDDVSRGDVLVADDFYTVTDRIDIAFKSLPRLKYPIKQRQLIKLHVGTTEVMGKIIFFDRNEIYKNEAIEIPCQLQLEEKCVVARGDRFIVRRPTPVETIGGGWVIDPRANKHRFGNQTIDQLKVKQDGTHEERLFDIMKEEKVLSKRDLLKKANLSEAMFNKLRDRLLHLKHDLYTLDLINEQAAEEIMIKLNDFHKHLPMRIGINQAELISELKPIYPENLLDHTLETLCKTGSIRIIDQYVSLSERQPSLPPQWKKNLETVEAILIEQGVAVEKWEEIIASSNIPTDILQEFYYYLLQTGRAFVFDEERLISKTATIKAIQKLAQHTNYDDFTLPVAREQLQLSRKNLIPFLELMDQLGYTKRSGNQRTWVKSG